MITIIKDIDLINDIEKYDVILIGTNTYHAMGNGFQRKIRLHYPVTYDTNLLTKYGDKDKLGTRITCKKNNGPIFSLCFIVNGYNFRPDLNPDYLDYDALESCIKTSNYEFSGKKVATTMIGCSKYDGNGNKERVMEILSNNTKDIDLYVYDYEQLDRNIESVIRYRSVVDNKEYDRETKTELINKMIEDDAKLPTMENPVKRLKRIKEDAKKLINN